MGIETYQEKNTRAMEKELAQSDIPVKRKIQKTIRKYTFLKYGIFRWFFGFFSSLVCRIELILFPLLLHFSPDRSWYPYIKFTTTFFFGPIMGIFKFWGSMWRVKTVTKFKNSFSPILIYWNDNRIHLGIIKKLNFPIWLPHPTPQTFSYVEALPHPRHPATRWKTI